MAKGSLCRPSAEGKSRDALLPKGRHQSPCRPHWWDEELSWTEGTSVFAGPFKLSEIPLLPSILDENPLP